MTPSNVFPLVLWELFFLLGYLAVWVCLSREVSSRRILPVVAAGVLVVYLCSVGFTALLYQYAACDLLIFYLFQVCYAAGLAAWLARLLWQERHKLALPSLLLLALDLAAVLFITLGSRLGEPARGGLQLVPFREAIQAAQNGSTYLLKHALLNVLLFVPTGILLSQLGPKRLRRVEVNYLAGLVLSTAIETVQLIAHLGLCDINDIICNALGAALGAVLYRFLGSSQEYI